MDISNVPPEMLDNDKDRFAVSSFIQTLHVYPDIQLANLYSTNLQLSDGIRYRLFEANVQMSKQTRKRQAVSTRVSACSVHFQV